MPKSRPRRKKPPKRILALPDLEHAKTAVLNSLTSASRQRTYDDAIREFVAWYCSEPRLERSIEPSSSGTAFTSSNDITRPPRLNCASQPSAGSRTRPLTPAF